MKISRTPAFFQRASSEVSSENMVQHLRPIWDEEWPQSKHLGVHLRIIFLKFKF